MKAVRGDGGGGEDEGDGVSATDAPKEPLGLSV